MANIQFSHISKTFDGKKDVVKNFNLEAEDGEFIVIVGPSGCGKSTVLRMVAGLEEITAGELLFDGAVVNNSEPSKRNVAMVFQNYALFPNMTVEENIGFALKMKRMPRKEREERVAQMAKILGLEDILKRKARKLSGGQCQRIAIGRALVCEPNVFLLDEPLSNLDAAMRMELRTEIAQLQRKLGVTTLYVTHDQTEAMTLGDRIVVMDQGEIQQVDTAQNIYCKPQNLFVAKFVGASTMNLFPGECVRSGNRIVVRVAEHDIELPEWKSRVLEDQGYVGKQVILGLRSEDIYPVCEGTVVPEGDFLSLDVAITAIDVVGAEKKLHFEMADAEMIAMARTYAAVSIGDTITMKLAIPQIHLFDPETQLAIVH